jgi:hypothetical protein
MPKFFVTTRIMPRVHAIHALERADPGWDQTPTRRLWGLLPSHGAAPPALGYYLPGSRPVLGPRVPTRVRAGVLRRLPSDNRVSRSGLLSIPYHANRLQMHQCEHDLHYRLRSSASARRSAACARPVARAPRAATHSRRAAERRDELASSQVEHRFLPCQRPPSLGKTHAATLPL